jgi:hypothetical protein
LTTGVNLLCLFPRHSNDNGYNIFLPCISISISIRIRDEWSFAKHFKFKIVKERAQSEFVAMANDVTAAMLLLFCILAFDVPSAAYTVHETRLNGSMHREHSRGTCGHLMDASAQLDTLYTESISLCVTIERDRREMRLFAAVKDTKTFHHRRVDFLA